MRGLLKQAFRMAVASTLRFPLRLRDFGFFLFAFEG